MSNAAERAAEDQFEAQNDPTGGDVPAGDSKDNDYVSRSGQYQIPVQKDEMGVESGVPDGKIANSDEYLRMSTVVLLSQCIVDPNYREGRGRSH